MAINSDHLVGFAVAQEPLLWDSTFIKRIRPMLTPGCVSRNQCSHLREQGSSCNVPRGLTLEKERLEDLIAEREMAAETETASEAKPEPA